MKKYLKIMYDMTEGFRLRYFFGFVLLFFSVIFMLLSSFLSKILVDTLMGDAPIGYIDTFLTNVLGGQAFLKENLWVFSLIIFGFGVSRALINIQRMIIRGDLNTSIGKVMQLKLFRHIERLPYPVLKKSKSGDIIQTSTRDEEVLRRFVINEVNMIMYTLFIVIFAFLILLSINPKIAFASVVILPVMAIYSFFLIKEVRKRYKKTDDSEGLMTAKIEENLSSVRVVKAYNNENHEIDEFEKYLKDYEKKFVHWRKASSFYFASTDILVFGQITLAGLFGIYLAYQRDISPGTLWLAISYVSMIVWPVRQVATILSNLARAVVSMDRINLILHQPMEDIDSGLTPPVKGDIVFENTGFKYDDGTETILKNINLHVKAGETIAIMGKTGSGKSTLSHLLTRLYDYTDGSIKIDGVELRDIQKRHIRLNIATVLQEPFLFSKTIINNLRVANKGASEEAIFRAAQIADIHQTIMSFKQGYETPVGEKGVTLSGGQKQRLAIARTIINEVPILVFDDSLSAVDTETDLHIRSALKTRAANTTTLIITHRIATAKDADRIIVLEEGTIVQCGSHDELVQQDGLYKRVYDIQTRMI